MSGLRGAVGFLTRVPVAASIQDETEIAKAVPWFPLVGAAVGVLIASVYAGSVLLLPPLVAATIAICAGLFVTGAFHEDGLADVVDAFWGGWDRERRIQILKDPRLGTYGVLAIGVALFARVGVVSSLDGWSAFALLPAAHGMSRAAAIYSMSVERLVSEGLGASYVRGLTAGQSRAGMIGGVVLGGIAVGWWVLPATFLGWAASRIVGSISKKKIGGITGDVLGAVQQVSEILILMMGAAAITLGYSLAWWHS